MSVDYSNFPLVTVFGGAGYIGSILTRLLIKENYRVRVFDNFLFGNHGIADLKSPLLEVIEGDICDTRAVSTAIQDAESVILLSALVGHRIEDIKSTDVRNINYLASMVVLEAAIEHGVERFIFASTNSVYGLQQGVMYETTIPEPISLYSRLKLRIEEKIINAKRRSFHPTALRIATCHGYSPRMRFDLVANSMLRDAICKKQLTIYNGEQTRSLMHVEDCARAFISCLKAHISIVSGEIFNVGSKEHSLQINQLANIIKSLIPETKIQILPGEADLTEYRLSSSKIEKLLNFTASWTVEKSLEQLRDMFYADLIPEPYSLKYQNT